MNYSNIAQFLDHGKWANFGFFNSRAAAIAECEFFTKQHTRVLERTISDPAEFYCVWVCEAAKLTA